MLASLVLPACEQPPLSTDDPLAQTWSALMEDGDVNTIAPGAAARTPPMTPAPLPRFCPGVTPPGDTSGDSGDCARAPLAFWTLDDCSFFSTQLNDMAFQTSQTTHPAFRSVTATCVAGFSGQAVRLAVEDDVVYAPDQPDFVFDRGLTIAAWINPDRLGGVQTIARKRLDGGSSFVLALDGRRLVFVARLTNGRLVGVTSERIGAGRLTNVAATYDGQNAILYIDGAEVARTRARGTIAAGAGPIFVGNDANGRRLRGVVDEIWLNTLAAPADVIAGFTCVGNSPLVRLTPEVTSPQPAGTTVPFDLAVTNTDLATCPPANFTFFGDTPFPLQLDPFFGSLHLAPGETGHVTIDATTGASQPPGALSFSYIAGEDNSRVGGGIATATYVVAPPAGPFSCQGSPPATPQIIGSPFSPTSASASYTFAAAGLAAPVVTPVFNPDGTTQALQVAATPGASSDPANAFLGFGMGFFNPPCLDARAYNAIRFTVTGDLGTCALAASLVSSEDNDVANGPFGTCTAGPGSCFPPQSGPLTTGVNVVHFTDLTGGSPVPTLNPVGLNAVQWLLNVPTDGASAPCVASFTVSEVSFITD